LKIASSGGEKSDFARCNGRTTLFKKQHGKRKKIYVKLIPTSLSKFDFEDEIYPKGGGCNDPPF